MINNLQLILPLLEFKEEVIIVNTYKIFYFCINLYKDGLRKNLLFYY